MTSLGDERLYRVLIGDLLDLDVAAAERFGSQREQEEFVKLRCNPRSPPNVRRKGV